MVKASDPGEKLQAVTTVLGELLGSPVSADDDFFEMGGHSLLLIEAIQRLRNEYGLIVSARQFIFDARVGAIASACIDSALTDEDEIGS